MRQNWKWKGMERSSSHIIRIIIIIIIIIIGKGERKSN